MRPARVSFLGSWTSPRLEFAADDVAQFLAATLDGLATDVDGLYLASSDSGLRESARFWRDALETTFAFANPRPFAWALATSPTGHLAKTLGIRGPTYTLLGDVGALVAVAMHALTDLTTGRIAQPLIVAMDGTPDQCLRITACVLHGDAVGPQLCVGPSGARSAISPSAAPAEALDTLRLALERGGDAEIGTDRDGWLRVGPTPNPNDRENR